jgi:hypothetical protein
LTPPKEKKASFCDFKIPTSYKWEEIKIDLSGTKLSAAGGLRTKNVALRSPPVPVISWWLLARSSSADTSPPWSSQWEPVMGSYCCCQWDNYSRTLASEKELSSKLTVNTWNSWNLLSSFLSFIVGVKRGDGDELQSGNLVPAQQGGKIWSSEKSSGLRSPANIKRNCQREVSALSFSVIFGKTVMVNVVANISHMGRGSRASAIWQNYCTFFKNVIRVPQANYPSFEFFLSWARLFF